MTIKTFYKNIQTGAFKDEATARATPEMHERHIITIEPMAEVIAAETEEPTDEPAGD